ADYRASEELLTGDCDPLTRATLYLGRARAALEALETSEGLAASERAMEIALSESNVALWISLAALRAIHLRVFGKIRDARSLLAQAEKTAQQNSELEKFAEGAGTFYLLMRHPTESKCLLMMSVNRANVMHGEYARISGYLVLAEVLLGNLCEAKKI